MKKLIFLVIITAYFLCFNACSSSNEPPQEEELVSETTDSETTKETEMEQITETNSYLVTHVHEPGKCSELTELWTAYDNPYEATLLCTCPDVHGGHVVVKATSEEEALKVAPEELRGTLTVLKYFEMPFKQADEAFASESGEEQELNSYLVTHVHEPGKCGELTKIWTAYDNPYEATLLCTCPDEHGGHIVVKATSEEEALKVAPEELRSSLTVSKYMDMPL